MASTMVDASEQRSPEWFEKRKKRVTASNVGAILGNDPYRTRNDAMRQMVREALGADREFVGNPATAWGTANEENARLDFEMETGLKVDPAPFVEFEDWAGASPDGWVGGAAQIEMKCPYGIRRDEMPVFKALKDQPHYYDQVQFQMVCTGRDKAYFWQWTPHGNVLEVVHVDYGWRDTNMPILRQFYAEFLHELAENAADYLAPKRVALDSPEAHHMVREWDEIAEQIGWLEERKKDLMEQMVRSAGDKNAEIAGRKLTKVEKAGSISYAKAFKTLMPEADLEPYRGKSSSFWKFT